MIFFVCGHAHLFWILPAVVFLVLPTEVMLALLHLLHLFSNAGISRSSTVIIAYLMKYRKMSMDDALDLVVLARPVAQPNAGFLLKLKEYEEHFPEQEETGRFWADFERPQVK